MTVAALREQLKKLGLETKGLKKDLVKRLEEYYKEDRYEDPPSKEDPEKVQSNQSENLYENAGLSCSVSDLKSESHLNDSSDKKNDMMETECDDTKFTVTEKKKKRRKRKKTIFKKDPLPDTEAASSVVVDYVPMEVQLENEEYSEFAHVFDHFRFKTQEEMELEEEEKEDNGMEIESKNDTEDKKENISKKKLKALTRMSVAELKTKVKHPEVVEWVDVTSSDPILLVELKSSRNTVPVPQHWSQKRRYLQGKRGVEKPPFELPPYIKATGIMELRAAVREKEASQKLKAKMRERMHPKLGKLDIEYQKLHDAFFKYQTRPENLTVHGDLYYEGKEFEIKFKFKRPGDLSEDLKNALNMPPNAPPPWLINMQRFGPPPSYPYLKLPGLNAPIPPGAQWGFHPGGWGKPPVDEFNRPLYGDVFGVAAQLQAQVVAFVDRKMWGELEQVEYEEEEEEVEEEDEIEEKEEEAASEEDLEQEKEDQGITIQEYVPLQSAVPQQIQLTKRTKPTEVDFSNEEGTLYTVIPQNEQSTDGFVKSQYTYDIAKRKRTEEIETLAKNDSKKAKKDSKQRDFKF